MNVAIFGESARVIAGSLCALPTYDGATPPDLYDRREPPDELQSVRRATSRPASPAGCAAIRGGSAAVGNRRSFGDRVGRVQGQLGRADLFVFSRGHHQLGAGDAPWRSGGHRDARTRIDRVLRHGPALLLRDVGHLDVLL